MAIHEEIKPDAGTLPYLMAQANQRAIRDVSARTAGTVVIPNADGTETVLGINGATQWVGDTTPPGKPLGISATSMLGTALIRWDGDLEGGIPDDFRCVRLLAKIAGTSDDPTTVGELATAGELNTGLWPAGTTLDIWAVALDDAHDYDGTPSYNVSAESEHMTCEIQQIVSQAEFDEAADEILAAAESSTQAHIELVNTTIGEISDAVAENTDAITLEQTLRAEGVKAAQDTANTVKAETEALKGDFKDVQTDVTTVKGKLTDLLTQTETQAEQMIVSSIIEYAVTTGTTAPTSGWSTSTPTVSGTQRAWMRTKITYGDARTEYSSPVPVTGAKGDTGAQGVSITAVTNFYTLATSKPAQPTAKSPGGSWTATEPGYVQGRNLYTVSRVDYSNGQWSYTAVQQSSTYGLASLALTTASGRNRRFVQPDAPTATDLQQGDEWLQTSSKPLECYWEGEPNNSVSVLVDHSNEIEHAWVWNGTRWNLAVYNAEHLFVTGTIASSLVTTDFFDGAVVKGGAFLTSNERIQLTNSGFSMVDTSGHPLVTLDATTGTATFQDVHIIDGAMSAGEVVGATIKGGEYQLLDAAGKQIGTINSSGMDLGGKLVYGYSSTLKQYCLTLDGIIIAKGEMRGGTMVAPKIYTNAEYNSSDASEKYRGVVVADGGLFAYKNNGKEEYGLAIKADGSIIMDGGLTSNLTIKAPSVEGGVFTGGTFQTRASNAYCIRLTGGKLDAYNESGGKIVEIDTSGAGKAKFIGSFRTGSGDSYITMESQSGLYSGSGYIRGVIKNSDVWTIHADYSKTGDGTMITSSWGLNLLGDEFLLAVSTSGFKALNITADTMSIAGNALYVNGQNLVPNEYTSAAFLSYSTGFQDYLGLQNNTSRCYAIKTGFIIVLQIEVSGKIPSSAEYTRVATLRPNWIPRRSINVPAAFNNGVQGTAFIIGEKADGTYTPGGVYFAQRSGSAATWCSATFVMFQSDLAAAADTAVAGSSVEAAQKLVTQGMTAAAAANLMNVPTASVTQ